MKNYLQYKICLRATPHLNLAHALQCENGKAFYNQFLFQNVFLKVYTCGVYSVGTNYYGNL